MKPSDEQFSTVFSKIQAFGQHWASLYHHNKRIYQVKLYIRGIQKKFSHIVLLWWGMYGSRPSGQLSNECGVRWCVNPDHYRDGWDREQAAWVDINPVSITTQLEQSCFDPEDAQLMHACNGDEAGMTRDFGCYHCGKRFDPLAGRSEVLCEACLDPIVDPADPWFRAIDPDAKRDEDEEAVSGGEGEAATVADQPSQRGLFDSDGAVLDPGHHDRGVVLSEADS